MSSAPRWRLAVLGAAAGLVLALSQRAVASGVATYQVTGPVNGYQVAAGSTIPVSWTGPGTSNVNLSLIDVGAWMASVTIASNTADDGQEYWTIPCDLPAGQYLVYIENVGLTDWTYGATFDILRCCPTESSAQRARPEVRIDRSRPMPRDRMRPRP
jgi:hypothetical protein